MTKVKPRKPKWRRKGESLESFSRRQHRYIDRVVAWMWHEDQRKK